MYRLLVIFYIEIRPDTIHLHHAHGPGEPTWGYLQTSRTLARISMARHGSDGDWGMQIFSWRCWRWLWPAGWWRAGLAMAPLVEADHRQERFGSDVAMNCARRWPACSAMPFSTAPPGVWCAWSWGPGRGSELRVAVADQGSGIAMGEQERIFERLQRSDSCRSRQSGGTGSELAIAQAIAVRHRGRLSVQSTPGGGSTFHLLLPAMA